jgi:serine/threonine-protein kinase/endoribonuclease IRE1
MTSNPPEATLVALENNATNVVGKDWCSQLDRSISTSLKQYRKYKGNSVRDLLRAMRNKVGLALLLKPSQLADK